MKQLLITAVILIVSITAKAQTSEKPLPITFDYREAQYLTDLLNKIDSTLTVSSMPTNVTVPILKRISIGLTIISSEYQKAVQADTDTTKKSKKIPAKKH